MKLNEYSYPERTGLSDAIKPYIGKNLWIHFHNFDKIGINPKRIHTDSYGIYFYPVDWLVNNPRYMTGNQYGVDMERYAIAEIDTNSNGIHLGTSKKEFWENLAKRNNWFDEYTYYSEEDGVTKYYYDDKPTGQKAWGIMKTIRSSKGLSWLYMLRGIDYIMDTNGFIHPNEEHQICVINPRIIKILDRGKLPKTQNTSPSDFSFWKKPIVKTMNILTRVMGGDIRWNNKIPTWQYDNENLSSKLSWAPYESSLLFNIKSYGTRRSWEISYHELFKLEYTDIINKIKETITDLSNLTQNENKIEFVPHIPIKDVRANLSKVFSEKDIDLAIDNKNKEYSFSFEDENSHKNNTISTRFYINVNQNTTLGRVSIRVNNSVFFSMNIDDLHDLDDLTKSLITNINDFSPKYTSHLNDREFSIFKRWFLGKCGIMPPIELDDYMGRQASYLLMSI